MLKFTALAASLALASASCPNQCSGHGYCDQNDRCICFRAPGTKGNYRAAYTGADCSLKVCPYGRSHSVITDVSQELLEVNYGSSNSQVGFIQGTGNTNSVNKVKAFLNNGFLMNRDVGVDINIVSVDTAAQKITFQYKFDYEQTFRFEREAALTGNPAADKYVSRSTAFEIVDGSQFGPISTGLYVYFDVSASDFAPTPKIAPNDRYYMNVTRNEGESFKVWNANTAHNLIECSGKGVCDRSVGTCKCAAGYTGDACQRTECLNDCSGHGVCQSQAYFAEDAIQTYSGFDADSQVGCKCDNGFRGPDCSMIECPSGKDPMGGAGGTEGRDCSGRGICDYSTGVCSCFKGYFGERCEEQTNLV